MSFQVESFDTATWADEVARRFASRVGPGRRLCLATGGTVGPLYRRITDLGAAGIFLLDEFGGLPLGDAGRCETMIRRDLLDHLADSPCLVVPDVDAPDPVSAARRFGEMVCEGGIDFAVVGLGANGHIGMNEPGSKPDTTTRVVDLAPSTTENAASYGATTAPTWGITIGMAELMAATEVWLVVTGRHKREILDRALTGAIGPHIPATYLREHPNCTLFADTAAFG